MYNKICSLLLLTALPVAAQAQLSAGSEGMTILSGTTFSTDELVMIPSADVLLVSNLVSHQGTTVTGTNGATSINRLYTIATPISYTGTIGFYYEDTELGLNTESALEVAFSATAPAAGWAQWTTTNGSALNTTDNFISQTFVTPTTIGRLTSTSNPLPLPLDLLSFQATKTANHQAALLRWTVSEDGLMPVYQVQRSTDARQFVTIGTLKGTGSGTQQYTFTDMQPAEGNNYYRLALSEHAGAEQYSSVALLQFLSGTKAVQALPNPFTDALTLRVEHPSLIGTEAVLSDWSGKEIHRLLLSDQTVTIQTNALATGVYMLRLSDGTTIKVVRQ